MLLSTCSVCCKKKSTFIKSRELQNFASFKMNKIINKFILTGDKSMPELPLKQPGFTYSAGGPFTKHLEKIQKFREAAHLKQVYKNELDKGWLVLSWYSRFWW